MAKLSQQQCDKLKNEQILCRICFERDICIVLLPCRHYVLCEACSDKCRSCPICRVSIENKLPVCDAMSSADSISDTVQMFTCRPQFQEFMLPTFQASEDDHREEDKLFWLWNSKECQNKSFVSEQGTRKSEGLLANPHITLSDMTQRKQKKRASSWNLFLHMVPT